MALSEEVIFETFVVFEISWRVNFVYCLLIGLARTIDLEGVCYLKFPGQLNLGLCRYWNCRDK